MAYTVEYSAERDNTHGDAEGMSSAITVQRATERFATEAEAVEFVSRLPPLRDPVLVTDDGQRIRGPALRLHLVGWQTNGAH